MQITATAPDLTDPRVAADRAHTAAGELTRLASQAGNTTVGGAIDTLAGSLRQTTVDDLVNAPAAWLQKRAERVSALAKACGL